MLVIVLPPLILGFGVRFIGVPVVLLLCILTFVWPAIRALRGCMLTLLALVTGAFVISVFITQNASYQNWANTLPLGLQLFVGIQFAVGLRLITVGMLAVTLARSGLKRRDLFLRRSDLAAPFQGKPVFQRSIPWWLVGVLLFVVVSGLTVLFLALSTRLVSGALPQLVLNLPFILTAGALNAFIEEFGWRSVLLARSRTVMGMRLANWLQATYFGLNHYFGTPGGPAGALMNIGLAWMFGKSVTETRGFTVNYLVHVAADSIIFAFFVISV
jgi:membrane protease YdiL (CAAX protease family)